MSADPRLRVLAAVLAQGRAVHLTTLVLTLGAWGLGGSLILSGVVLLVAGAETWFAARVGVDAQLFEALADGAQVGDLDRGLVELGLVAERAPRALTERISGAVRLWHGQLALAGMQGTLALLALFLRGLW